MTPLRPPRCGHVTSQLFPVGIDDEEDAIQSSGRTSSPVINSSSSSSSSRRGRLGDVTDLAQSLPQSAVSFSRLGLAPGTDFTTTTAAVAGAWCPAALLALAAAAAVQGGPGVSAPPRAAAVACPDIVLPLFHATPLPDHLQRAPADHRRRLTADDSAAAAAAAQSMTRQSTDLLQALHDRPPMLRPRGWPQRRVPSDVARREPSRSTGPRVDLARSLTAADILFSDARTLSHHLGSLNPDRSPSMWSSSLFVSQQTHHPATTPLTDHRHHHHHRHPYYQRYAGGLGRSVVIKND